MATMKAREIIGGWRFKMKWWRWFLVEQPSLFDPLWLRWRGEIRRNPDYDLKIARWEAREPRPYVRPDFRLFWAAVAIVVCCTTLRRVRSNAFDFSREGTIDAVLLWDADPQHPRHHGREG